MNRTLLILSILGVCPRVFTQDAAPTAPLCAQSCLASATDDQKGCMGLDVKCLCASSDFIDSLYCCLSTECSPADQQKGIEFNIVSCGAVNETVPSFVGCSPNLDQSAAATGSAVSTITGAVEPALTKVIDSNPTTVSFDGRKLLTGTCTEPHFAQVTNENDAIVQFAEIGCSEKLEQCCPFDSHENAVISECPQDYSTTAGACCPSGWQLYSTELGGQTPCYTTPTITYVPEKTPTAAGATVIPERLFARRFDLSESALEGGDSLNGGSIAGIVIGMLALLAIIGGLIWFLRRRRKAMAERQPTEGRTSTLFSRDEMAVKSPTSVTHELASPHAVPPSPSSPGSAWVPSSAASYDRGRGGGGGAAVAATATAGHGSSPSDHFQKQSQRAGEGTVAQELPGSTFIFEHHPVYSSPTIRPETMATVTTTAHDAPAPASTARVNPSPSITPAPSTPPISPSKPSSVSPGAVSPLMIPRQI